MLLKKLNEYKILIVAPFGECYMCDIVNTILCKRNKLAKGEPCPTPDNLIVIPAPVCNVADDVIEAAGEIFEPHGFTDGWVNTEPLREALNKYREAQG